MVAGAGQGNDTDVDIDTAVAVVPDADDVDDAVAVADTVVVVEPVVMAVAVVTVAAAVTVALAVPMMLLLLLPRCCRLLLDRCCSPAIPSKHHLPNNTPHFVALALAVPVAVPVDVVAAAVQLPSVVAAVAGSSSYCCYRSTVQVGFRAIPLTTPCRYHRKTLSLLSRLLSVWQSALLLPVALYAVVDRTDPLQ